MVNRNYIDSGKRKEKNDVVANIFLKWGLLGSFSEEKLLESPMRQNVKKRRKFIFGAVGRLRICSTSSESMTTMNTARVKEILSWYGSDNPGTLTNLARLLNHGKLAGTGRLVILPVDQGFEHGPARSFAVNPAGYDPRYHFELAIESGCNAYAAPLGFIEAGAREFAGEIPLILKINNHDVLYDEKDPLSAVTASVEDALRLGCAAIGFTIYPGSRARVTMYQAIARGGGSCEKARIGSGGLVLSARFLLEQGRGDGDGCLRLRGADRGGTGRAHHQGQTAQRASGTGAAKQSV